MFSFFKKKRVFAELVPQVYFRHTYNCNTLQKEDFINGFGINTNLLRKVIDAKGIKHEREQYDNRIGYYITGEKINTRIHPLHSKRLLNIETGKRYVIDTVTYCHWYGEYISLMVRVEGSKSHKEVLWENISCHYEDFVNDIEENRKLYTLIDAVELHNY